MQEMIDSLKYVIQANLFWQSMGMTAATAMFIGAILFHESNASTFRKAIITVGVYSVFLIFTSVARVTPHVSEGILNQKTYASAITTLLITIAYVFGLIVGYCLLRGKDERKRRT